MLLSMGLALVGCQTLNRAAERATGLSPLSAVRPLQAAAPGTEEAAAEAPASRPHPLVQYWRHRCADFADIFTLTFAVAPPWHAYGADFSAGLLNFNIGLGYMHVASAYQCALEGRGAYAGAPYRRELWRFLWSFSDEEVVEVEKGVGNFYVKPEAYDDSPYQPFYLKWAQIMTTTGANSYSMTPPWSDTVVPAQRLVHNSDQEGAYRTCPDGWQRHIGAVHLDVAIPGDPFIFKFATKIGIGFNWCQVMDFVLGLVCIDYYGDDVFGKPGVPARIGP